jgi:hypothetical protein
MARLPASRNAGSLPLRMYARMVCTWMPRASAASSGVRYSCIFFFSLATPFAPLVAPDSSAVTVARHDALVILWARF